MEDNLCNQRSVLTEPCFSGVSFNNAAYQSAKMSDISLKGFTWSPAIYSQSNCFLNKGLVLISQYNLLQLNSLQGYFVSIFCEESLNVKRFVFLT